jgi:hypothetical protein
VISEDRKEYNSQFQRDRYAAEKLFWQTFIAHKDGYDTLVCVECHLPETDRHNRLFPITILQPNPLLSLTPSLGDFFTKPVPNSKKKPGNALSATAAVTMFTTAKLIHQWILSLAVLLTVLFLVIRAVVGILFVLKQGINISAIMIVRAVPTIRFIGTRGINSPVKNMLVGKPPRRRNRQLGAQQGFEPPSEPMSPLG